MTTYDSGIQFIAHGDQQKFRKVLITGLGRSGTSAVASIFHHIGFFLGTEANAPIYEDILLRAALSEGRIEDILSSLSNDSERYPLFAWKDPKLFSDAVSKLIDSLNNDWLLVLVFRDPVAIALRRVYQENAAFLHYLDRAVHFQNKLARFANKSNKPLLLISYEKLLTQPERVIKGILEFIDYKAEQNVDVIDVQNKIRIDKDNYKSHAARKIN